VKKLAIIVSTLALAVGTAAACPHDGADAAAPKTAKVDDKAKTAAPDKAKAKETDKAKDTKTAKPTEKKAEKVSSK
jgi:hypothetical protein